MRTVFLEYAWDMGWCDPCAAHPLSPEELQQLGVFWLNDGPSRGGGQGVFVTRLHVRYDAEHFPDDLRFQQTADRSNSRWEIDAIRTRMEGTGALPAGTPEPDPWWKRIWGR